MSDLGKRLKFWRESIPKTLDELASETGIPKSNLSYYETKAASLPHEAQVKLKAYGAPVSWILTGDGQMIAGSEPEPWEGLISKEVFDAIQRAVQNMENTIRGVPAELREGIDTRRMGYVVAQMVDDLLAGEQERIVEAMSKFLASVPRKAPKP